MTVNELILVRHGESDGNVAAAAADRAHQETVEIAERDADVALSALGRAQAQAVGRWLHAQPADQRPTALVSSPYRRAVETATLALQDAELDVPVRLDERLRDRELGILDRLTGRGVAARFPDEAQRRRHLGKFYYRPPGGESWADVALRLRSVLAEVTADGSLGPRVMLTCHDAVILLVRYVLERQTEQELTEMARSGSVSNAGITRIAYDTASATWRTSVFNDVSHVAELDVPSTVHPGERR